jgi:alkane 1-monooxygenase
MYAIKKIWYYLAFLLPALVVVGFYTGGFWNWLAPFTVFIMLPLVDFAVGIDPHNLNASEVKKVNQEFYYRFITFVWTYVQLAFVIWGCYAAATGRLVSALEWIGFTLSVGLVTGGIGITVAHELGHKKTKLEQFYSKALLMTVCYMHFYIEHNKGHHVQVATPEDPATARRGENFYAFWVRSVFMGYHHAWQLEKQRLKEKEYSIFSFHNQMIVFALLPILFCGVITFVLSVYHARLVWEVPLFFFAQSGIAFTLLELVNYIEHYGIVREKNEDGLYERVTILHSWNASHLVSNFFLFQLQRHSDHHAHASKWYQVLDHYDESPQLPFSYPTMILVALVPPAWFALIHPRLNKWSLTLSKATSTPK